MTTVDEKIEEQGAGGIDRATELTSCGETHGLVDIRRGLFQGNILSPHIFAV